MARKENFDVVVVGSGASGGWACKRLSEAGLKIALVDNGRPVPESEFTEHKAPYELKYRDRAPEVLKRTRPVQKLFCSEYNYHWFANDLEEPYTTPENMPFTWVGRLRVPAVGPWYGGGRATGSAISILRPLPTMATVMIGL